MSLCVDRTSRGSVQHSQLRSLVPECLPGVLPLKNPRLEIVRRQGRVDRIRRIGSRVQTDDQNAFVARFLDRTKNSRGVRRRDQDTLDSGTDEIFDGRHLPFVIAVKLAEASEELSAVLFGLRRCRLPEFDEVGIDLGFGDQSN